MARGQGGILRTADDSSRPDSTESRDVGSADVAKQRQRNERMFYNVSFIFEMLHKKEPAAPGFADSLMEQRMKSIMMEGKRANISIPDTVVYKHGYPCGWYFTSVLDATIKRKRTENLNPGALLEAFEDADDPERVVAYFVNTTWDVQLCPTNNVTFMDSRELRRFILAQNPMSEGFLQRFIPYKTEKHGHKASDTTLHCTWTPHKCFVEQRMNLVRNDAAGHQQMDKSRDLNMLETKTDVIKLSASNKLHVRIAAVCEQIASHVFKVTKDKQCLTGITGYFKLSRGNRLFFLWASGITVERKPGTRILDSVGTINGRFSPPILVPKFHGANKNALDHKEDVVGYKPPPGTACRICKDVGDTSSAFGVTYLMLMECIKEESDLEKVRRMHAHHVSNLKKKSGNVESIDAHTSRPLTPRGQHRALVELLSNAKVSKASLHEQAFQLREGMRLLGFHDQDSVSDIRRHATAASISPTHSLEVSPRVHPTLTHKELFEKDADLSLFQSPDALLSPVLQGSGKSNRALATPKAPLSAGRSAGEGRSAEECVVTDELDFENAAKWLATEWGAQVDKASQARDAASRVGTSGGQGGKGGRAGGSGGVSAGVVSRGTTPLSPLSPAPADVDFFVDGIMLSAIGQFGTGDQGEEGGGGEGGGGGGDEGVDSRQLSGDTDKKPREMPERMKELVMQQGMSQRMVCTVAPSHPMLRKWMAARNLLPTKSFAFAPTVALVRRATVQALIKAPSHAAGASADTSDTIQSQEEAARAMFESIDKNGDGRLDEEELLTAFPFLDRAQVDALMQAADANSDGYMSFDEIWALIQADQIGGDDAEADAHRPQTTGSDDINEVRQIFSPVRFETQAFQLGEEAMIDQIQDPEASLAKLYERVAVLFDDFDVTESGTLGRIELAMGLEDYGYLEVERDIVFHVMDHNNDGKITFPNFFRSIWVMSEHVLGLSQLLSESYGEDINEDGLRRVLDFLRPRVVTLQRKFRQMRRERRTQQAQEAKEATGSETAKDRRSKDSEGNQDTSSQSRALSKVVAEALNEKTQGQRSQAMMEARLEIINLRIEQNRRIDAAAKRTAEQWKHVVQETWPMTMQHIKQMLPSKEACLLIRRCRDNPLVDPMFARKKIWVCELCCRKYNKQASAVFETAEASQLADLQAHIWERIYTLEDLSSCMTAATVAAGRGGGLVAQGVQGRVNERPDSRIDVYDEAREDWAGASAGFSSSRSIRTPATIETYQVQLPTVPGAVREDRLDTLLPANVVGFSPQVDYHRYKMHGDQEDEQLQYYPAALPRGGTHWRKRPPLDPTYPVTEVPAPCSPRRYDSLNNFGARMRDFKVMPADGQHRSWWRPAGAQARGWAEAPEVPEGFRLPELVAQSSMACQDAERAAYLAESARLRTLPKTLKSAREGISKAKAKEASAGEAEEVRSKNARGRMVKRGLQGDERIAGLTPRARWFQPKVSIGGSNNVWEKGEGEVAPLPLPPNSQPRAVQGPQTHRLVTNVDGKDCGSSGPGVPGAELDMAAGLSDMVRQVRDVLNRSASPPRSRPGARSPRTALVRQQLQHAASVPGAGGGLDASLLSPADMGVLEDVQFVLISRFRDIYSAYAAFGGGATDSEDWKLSPSSFYRTLLRLGAEDEVVEAAMQALAPFCSDGHLALHDFVALFSWHSDQGILGARNEVKALPAAPLAGRLATEEPVTEPNAASRTPPKDKAPTAVGSDAAPEIEILRPSSYPGGAGEHGSSGPNAPPLRALPSVTTWWVHAGSQQATPTGQAAHEAPTQRSPRMCDLPSVISWYVHAPLPTKRDNEHQISPAGAQLEATHQHQAATHGQAQLPQLQPPTPREPQAPKHKPRRPAIWSSKRAVKHQAHQTHGQSDLPLAQEQELQELFVSLRSSYPQGQRPGRPLRAAYQLSRVPTLDFKWGDVSGDRTKDNAKSRNLKVQHAYGAPLLPRAPPKAKPTPRPVASSPQTAAGAGLLKAAQTPPELQEAAVAELVAGGVVGESAEVLATEAAAPDLVMMTATDLSADETDTYHTDGGGGCDTDTDKKGGKGTDTDTDYHTDCHGEVEATDMDTEAVPKDVLHTPANGGCDAEATVTATSVEHEEPAPGSDAQYDEAFDSDEDACQAPDERREHAGPEASQTISGRADAGGYEDDFDHEECDDEIAAECDDENAADPRSTGPAPADAAAQDQSQ